MLVSFWVHKAYQHEEHGKDIPAQFVKVSETGEQIYLFGISHWPWRLWSTVHSIFNLSHFSEAVFPYILAVLAISEILGFGLVSYMVSLF